MTEFYYKDLCDKIIGICFDVFNEFDYGYRENFYEKVLYDKLIENNISVSNQFPVRIRVNDRYFVIRRVDFFIENIMFVELKVGRKLSKRHFEQANEYLHVLNLRLALLILFSPKGVVIRRVVNDPEYK
ncbi:MAG: GxxExxY protein [Patescibacteria group bacterium]